MQDEQDAINIKGYNGLYDRLMSVKQKYDPYNLLQQNVNINARHTRKLPSGPTRESHWRSFFDLMRMPKPSN